MAEIKSIDFLPDNLKDRELYVQLAPLLDWALQETVGDESTILDPMISELRIPYHDAEAVNAYFNKFVKPIVGTRGALEYIFGVMGIQAKIIEWFESEVPIPAFKFIIQFKDYPGNVDLDSLLSLIESLRNERSKVTSIRLEDCPDNIILGYGELDGEYLSSSEGYLNDTGVLICLHQNHLEWVDASVWETSTVAGTGVHMTWYVHGQDARLDFMDLDRPWTQYDVGFQASQASLFSISFQYYVGGGYCVPSDQDTPVYCQIEEVANSAYPSATFQSQTVLSDYCQLSDGTGFVGELLDVSSDADTRLGYMVLDDITVAYEPIIFIEYIIRQAANIVSNWATPLAAIVMQCSHQQTIAPPTPNDGVVGLFSEAINPAIMYPPRTWRMVGRWNNTSWNTALNGPNMASEHTSETV